MKNSSINARRNCTQFIINLAKTYIIDPINLILAKLHNNYKLAKFNGLVPAERNRCSTPRK